MENYFKMRNSLSTSSNLCPHFLSLLLEKCNEAKASRPARQIHALFIASATDMNQMSINSKLIGLYGSVGDIRAASHIFENMRKPTVFALNWMILASAFQGFYEEAIGYFSMIRGLRNCPNNFTFSVVLKACVGLLDIAKGKEVHSMISKLGFESDVSVANALIDMYYKCGSLRSAHSLFDNMFITDVTSWTSLICGYCSMGNLKESLDLFEKMKLVGLKPNEFTWNVIITGYARNGDCNGAFLLFSQMKKEGLAPDLVTFNSMLSGFVQSHQFFQAVRLFQEMLILGIKPNPVTVTGFLPAFGLMGFIQRGKEVHGLIFRLALDANVFVTTALIDMYSKCGSIGNASNVFENAKVRNIATWNAMIGCYGKNSMVSASIQLFDRMHEEGIRANEVTLTSVLSACSHGGLIEKALSIFRSMKEKCGVKAQREHYACVVDLLCRAGKMEDAYELVKEMRMEVTNSIIGAFFNGCKIHGRRDLAKGMAENILKMDLKNPAGYVTLSNIFAENAEWEEVVNLRKLMREKGVDKNHGYSLVEKRNWIFLLEVGKES